MFLFFNCKKCIQFYVSNLYVLLLHVSHSFLACQYSHGMSLFAKKNSQISSHSILFNAYFYNHFRHNHLFLQFWQDFLFAVIVCFDIFIILSPFVFVFLDLNSGKDSVYIFNSIGAAEFPTKEKGIILWFCHLFCISHFVF